ncbi:phenylalanine--tRNA ligase subunit beta [Candidatus Woesearchaeota archaeon]|nr:phenylalanine--tRNA ligase subunit beta [Candidatus Woesearchaeota archaeon]
MPTITFSLKDCQQLIGKKITFEHVESMLRNAKAELTINGDEIKAELGDTNLPYLWSVEGIARYCKNNLQLPNNVLHLEPSSQNIIVEKSVKTIRPWIAGFSAEGPALSDAFLKQMIQFQEKFCESYGRRRQKIAIGLYPSEHIAFPITYTAVAPESITFIPLGMQRQLSLKQILEQHSKGKEYAWILEGMKTYPLLKDAKQQVLSFPPIINAEKIGKLEIGMKHIFFEATGTDEEAVNLAAVIFAYAFAERGYKVMALQLIQEKEKLKTPRIEWEKKKISPAEIEKLLGVKLKEQEIASLLIRSGYQYAKGVVSIPPYRTDVLHAVDIIEDIAIVYDFNKIPEQQLATATIGSAQHIVSTIDTARDLMVGLGFQEILSPFLSNKGILTNNMQSTEEVVEIDNVMSETYSAVRNSLLPILLELLSKNKHVSYPQKVFEQGIATKRDRKVIADHELLTGLTTHEKANYTEIRQVLDFVLNMMGVAYQIKEATHPSFLQGRAGKILVQGKEIGFLGEIHPQVLENFNIEMPVAGFEIDIQGLEE